LQGDLQGLRNPEYTIWLRNLSSQVGASDRLIPEGQFAKSRVTCALFPTHSKDCLNDQRHVRSKGYPPNVLFRQGDFLRQNATNVLVLGISGESELCLLIVVFQRREIGKTRPNGKDFLVIRSEEVHILRNFGSRTDETHFPPEHID